MKLTQNQYSLEKATLAAEPSPAQFSAVPGQRTWTRDIRNKQGLEVWDLGRWVAVLHLHTPMTAMGPPPLTKWVTALHGEIWIKGPDFLLLYELTGWGERGNNMFTDNYNYPTKSAIMWQVLQGTGENRELWPRKYTRRSRPVILYKRRQDLRL